MNQSESEILAGYITVQDREPSPSGEGCFIRIFATYLLGPLRTVRVVHQQIDKIQEVHQQRMVQLLQLLLPIEVLRIEPLEALRLQWPYDVVLGTELLTEHLVGSLDRCGRLRRSVVPNVFIGEQLVVLRRRKGERTDLDGVGILRGFHYCRSELGVATNDLLK